MSTWAMDIVCHHVTGPDETIYNEYKYWQRAAAQASATTVNIYTDFTIDPAPAVQYLCSPQQRGTNNTKLQVYNPGQHYYKYYHQ